MKPSRLHYILAAVMVLFVSISAQALAGTPSPSIVVVNSYHKGYAWSDAMVQGIEEHLRMHLPALTLHIEYMDTKRITTQKVQKPFAALMEAKYAANRPDLLLVTDDNAFQQVISDGWPVFSGVPTVFAGVNHFVAQSIRDYRNITGLVQQSDIKATLDTALALHPETATIAVICDASTTGQAYMEQVRSTRPRFSPYNFIFLNGLQLTTDQLLDRLSTLPQNSVVLLCIWMVEKDGKYLDWRRVYPLISSGSPAPVYGVVEMMLGHGVVGGRMQSGRHHGTAAAAVALEILAGKPPASIPVRNAFPEAYRFDHEQLRRWKIEDSRLPPDSKILNTPTSVWYRYRSRIGMVTALLVLLCLAIVIMGNNIVQRRAAERRLVRTSGTLSSILSSATEYAICATDRDLVVIHYNPAAEKLFGMETKTVLGKTVTETSLMAILFPHGLGRVCQFLKNGKHEFDFRIHYNGEDPRYGRGTVMPMRREDGKPGGYLLFAQDITRIRNLEKQLHQSQKMEAIGTLAGGIAHDFNNILGAIFGYTQLAEMKSDNAGDVRHYLQRINRVAERARDLTTQILTFSRQSHAEKHPCDIRMATREALHLLRASLPPSIGLDFDPQDALEPVMANETQVYQVLINLCTNAAHAILAVHETGTIRITLGNTSITAMDETDELDAPLPGTYVGLTVSDNGCGMSPSLRKRVLEPYFTTKEKGRGTGMGLSTVHGIVRDHGGFLRIASSEGQGSAISVFFPAGQQLSPASKAINNALPGGDEHILFVDDEMELVEIGKHLLEELGYRVSARASAMDALAALREGTSPVDLLVTDLSMPEMTGIELSRRAVRANPGLPVILCTGFSTTISPESTTRAGIAATLEKPLTLTRLAETVRQVLDREVLS